MKEENRAARRAQIAEAAYALLQDKGYGGMSMLAVARAARASNETLYRWYGDKQGLFLALIRDNAAEVRTLLDEALAGDRPPMQALQALGPVLLGVLTGARAVALNRAAAADAGRELGAALAEAGRGSVAPLIARVMEQAQKAGDLGGDDPAAAAALYIDLLVGDLQIRRVIGAVPEPGEAECRARADLALARLRKLLLPPG